ncbi:single-stranded DNA-binding protein WHY2, mitochondrial [Aristolochia californica]|uniref:single-stranded DNA-binding protein WHY2, mitochondrial n=1 Tax=Aristolochia californica TaxID=171875 RepID=UPI0035E26D1F
MFRNKEMAKLTQFLSSRSYVAEKFLSASLKEPSRLYSFIFRAGISTVRQSSLSDGSSSLRARVDYSLFKGKAALAVQPVLPKFKQTDYGMQIEKRGGVMLTFWPANASQKQKYDWEKKQYFLLSATEVGAMISLGPTESCEFFHDPSMKTSLAGQVRKSFSVSPTNDGGGYFFSLNVTNNNLKTSERLFLPVTKAEFAVMRSAFSFALPYVMGWNRVTNPTISTDPLPTTVGVNKQRNPEYTQKPDLEWSR